MLDRPHKNSSLIDFDSARVAIDSLCLKPRSAHNYFTLNINSFLDVILPILFAYSSNKGVWTVSFSPHMYIPLAYVISLWGKGMGTHEFQGTNPYN